MANASYERGHKGGPSRTPDRSPGGPGRSSGGPSRSPGGPGRRPSPPPEPRGGFSRRPAGPPPHHKHKSGGGCLTSMLTMLLSIGLCSTLIGMCIMKK